LYNSADTPGLQSSKSLRWNPYIKSRSNVSKSAAATRNPGIVSSEILLQSSDHAKMDFVGREGTGDDTDSQVKHYVAVVDPEEKTWKVVEVRRATLRGAVRTRRVEEEDSEEELVCPILFIARPYLLYKTQTNPSRTPCAPNAQP
jgi:DNA-directed RNA polymerase I subunit RPA49